MLEKYPHLSKMITSLLKQYNKVSPPTIISNLNNLINIQKVVSILDRNVKKSKRKHFYDFYHNTLPEEYLKKPWIILLKDKYDNGFSKDTRHFIADGKIVEITDEDCKKGFKKIVCKQLQYSDVPKIGFLVCGERSRDGSNYDNRVTINLLFSKSKVLFVDESNQIFSSCTGSKFLYDDDDIRLGVYSMKDRLYAGFNEKLYIAYNKTLQEIGDDFKKRFSAEEIEKLDSRYSLECYNKYKEKQNNKKNDNNIKPKEDKKERQRKQQNKERIKRDYKTIKLSGNVPMKFTKVNFNKIKEIIEQTNRNKNTKKTQNKRVKKNTKNLNKRMARR